MRARPSKRWRQTTRSARRKSAKRWSTSTRPKFVFFTDRDLGKKFPTILRVAGLSVQCHADHFADDTPDQSWLAAVGGRGWVVLTHDRQIGRKANERDAVMRHGIRLLVVVGKAPFPELAESFVRTLPRIERFVERHTPPYIAKVYRASPSELHRNPTAPGRIALWLPGPG